MARIKYLRLMQGLVKKPVWYGRKRHGYHSTYPSTKNPWYNKPCHNLGCTFMLPSYSCLSSTNISNEFYLLTVLLFQDCTKRYLRNFLYRSDNLLPLAVHHNKDISWKSCLRTIEVIVRLLFGCYSLRYNTWFSIAP